MTLGILAFAEGPLSSLGKQDAVAVVTGQALTSVVGTASAHISVQPSVSGNPLSLVQGNESVVAETFAAPSGVSISSALGTVSVEAIQNQTISVTGFGLNQVIGTFAVTASGAVAIDASSEPDLDIFTGTPTVVADANVTLTGQSIGTLTTGTVTIDAVTPVPVSTNVIGSNLGTITVNAASNIAVTGQAVSSALGSVSVVANSTAIPNGNIISSSLGSVTTSISSEVDVTGLTTTLALSDNTAIYVWGEVDDSETSTWNEVNSSSTNTWTEVDDNATNTWQDAA